VEVDDLVNRAIRWFRPAPPEPRTQGFTMLRAVAETGDAEAQFALGRLLIAPVPGPPNRAEAAHWLAKAAAQGHHQADALLRNIHP
jgi:TPR repeat protein